MSWQFLVAISVLSSSVVIPFQRVLLHKDKSDPIAFVIVSQALTAVLLSIPAVVYGIHLPDLSKYWFIIVAMFALYTAGHILYADALGRVEASVFSTLLNTNTIWIVLMGYVVFQEQPHFPELLGTLLILSSVGMLAERAGKRRLDKNVWMGLVIGLIFGLAASAWIYVGKDSDVVTWTAVSFAGTPLIVLLLKPSSVRKMRPFLGYGILTRMLLLAAFWAISNLASLAAYQHGVVSLVAPLQKTSVIVTVLLAIIFLRERARLWQKTFAAIVCFVGVLLIIA